MLIQTYGLHWKRDDVFWGNQGPNGSGSLLGIPSKARKRGEVDFREQIGFYALYDKNFKLMYIGQAGKGKGKKLFDRLKNHRSNHLARRWSLFSWFGRKRVKKTDGTLSVKTKNVWTNNDIFLSHIEAVLIAVSEPPLNKQSGQFGDAEEYLQFRDERLG